jgi:hypothetical protein
MNIANVEYFYRTIVRFSHDEELLSCLNYKDKHKEIFQLRHNETLRLVHLGCRLLT